jgi:hypothetical protein
VEKLDHGLFALIVCRSDFFITWQVEWFHAHIVLGFCVFDNTNVLSVRARHA